MIWCIWQETYIDTKQLNGSPRKWSTNAGCPSVPWLVFLRTCGVILVITTQYLKQIWTLHDTVSWYIRGRALYPPLPTDDGHGWCLRAVWMLQGVACSHVPLRDGWGWYQWIPLDVAAPGGSIWYVCMYVCLYSIDIYNIIYIYPLVI
jgi:hypothetical protein